LPFSASNTQYITNSEVRRTSPFPGESKKNTGTARFDEPRHSQDTAERTQKQRGSTNLAISKREEKRTQEWRGSTNLAIPKTQKREHRNGEVPRTSPFPRHRRENTKTPDEHL
jgi:hypothetical protein